MTQNINQNNMHQHNQSPQQIHLSDYLNIIKRRKWVVIIIFLVIVSIVTIKTFRTKPIYKATTKIIIERTPSHVIKMQEVLPISPREDDYYQTQYDILNGRNLAYKVINNLELNENIDSDNKNKSSSNICSNLSIV